MERKNEIIQDKERPSIIYDLEGSEMGEWEGHGIPLEGFDGVRKARIEKLEGYDLWATLSPVKADITFGQLLEISPMSHKTLKEGMPVTRRTRKVKTKMAAIFVIIPTKMAFITLGSLWPSHQQRHNSQLSLRALGVAGTPHREVCNNHLN